jgi:hypothetical protein
MKRIIMSVLLLVCCCSDRHTGGNDPHQAMKYYKDSRTVAEQWLKGLDKDGYRYFLKMQLPEPFTTKYKGREKELEDGLTRLADTNEKVFGYIKNRKFMGVHIWCNGKLLTWLPNVEKEVAARINKPEVRDHFCEIDPKNIGFEKASDIFIGFPSGNYAIMIYKAVPVRKRSAEEKLTLWQDPDGAWRIVSYTITDDTPQGPAAKIE